MTHSDVNPLCPPRRRIGCVALIRNTNNDILLVQPEYKDGMILPGGGARAEENPRDAVVREVREETGLIIQHTGVIALDYVRPSENGLEGLNLIFDGGHVENGDLETGPEISSYAWLAEEDLAQYLKPYQLRRVRQAVAAADAGWRISLLEHGHLYTGFEHTNTTDESQGT